MSSPANSSHEFTTGYNPALLIDECIGAGLVPILPFEARALNHSQDIQPVTAEAIRQTGKTDTPLHDKLRQLASHSINGNRRTGIVLPYPEAGEERITLGSAVVCQGSSLQRPGTLSQFIITGHLKELPVGIAELFPAADDIDPATMASPLGQALMHKTVDGAASYTVGRRQFDLRVLRVSQLSSLMLRQSPGAA